MDAPRGIERKAIKNTYYRISGGGSGSAAS